nr:uncharacterized protein LOC105869205 isoform X3 [Microcebus murinus]
MIYNRCPDQSTNHSNSYEQRSCLAPVVSFRQVIDNKPHSRFQQANLYDCLQTPKSQRSKEQQIKLHDICYTAPPSENNFCLHLPCSRLVRSYPHNLIIPGVPRNPPSLSSQSPLPPQEKLNNLNSV